MRITMTNPTRTAVLPRLLLILLPVAVACGPRAVTPTAPVARTVTFAFCGDIFLHSQNIAAAWDDSTQGYEFDPVFSPVRPLLDSADFAVCWLGGEFSNTPPYRGYPLFRSPARLLHAIEHAGFDVCLATNHIMDGGRTGLAERIRLLDSLGLLHPGEFSSPTAARRPLVIEKHGLRVALLSYTYGTNDLPVPEPWMVSLIDTARMADDVHRAESLEVDFTIVMLHQGEEYRLTPTDEQVRIAEFLARLGVDLVVSSHPHVVEPAGLVGARRDDGTLLRMPVLTFSLGNFYCGQRFPNTRTGLIVRVQLAKDSSGVRIAEAGFTPVFIYDSRRLPGRYRVLAIKDALAGFASGADSTLTASDTADLRRELDAVTARVSNPSIPFLAR
jgi:poly-gamma-glutamate capsule biosynthesis protein CapA/YwtB (metallophosphatase superfamily)